MASDGNSNSLRAMRLSRAGDAAFGSSRRMTSVLWLACAWMVLATFEVCEARAHDLVLSSPIGETRAWSRVAELGASWGTALENVNQGTAADVEAGTGGASKQVAQIESRPLGGSGGAAGAKPAAAMSETANGPRGASPAGNELMRVAGAMVIVVGLLLGVRLVLRRVGTGIGGAMRGEGAIEIVARYPVARGQRLLLVRLANRIVLVHQSGSSMTALSEIAEPAEVEEVLSQVGGSGGSGAGQRVASLFGGLLANRGLKAWEGSAGGMWPPVEVVDLTQGGARRSGRDAR
ncbi:MAG: flagellar biosynthetic protein FliO [Phycisphaerales bacterium]|nr:flagellar biosynthetic protein FliO [Phycisphaerales bacterium]MCI0674304.1 flagellar biosynthetic protein FliO [Phycisphaerales bacterium]